MPRRGQKTNKAELVRLQKTLEVLTRAQSKIRQEKNWTQQTEARDGNGWPYPPRSKRAICWCAWGALVATSGMRLRHMAAKQLASVIAGHPGPEVSEVMLLTTFNDRSTHAKVLRVFAEARTNIRRRIRRLRTDIAKGSL